MQCYRLLQSKLKGEWDLKDEAKLLRLELQAECKKNKRNLQRLQQAMHNKIQAQFFATDLQHTQQQQKAFTASSRAQGQGQGDGPWVTTGWDAQDSEDDMENMNFDPMGRKSFLPSIVAWI